MNADQVSTGFASMALADVRARPSVLPAPAFVAVAMQPSPSVRTRSGDDTVAVMDMQARLPNGAVTTFAVSNRATLAK